MVFDIICFCFLLVSIILGLTRGFIGSLLNFIAFLLSVTCAFICYFCLNSFLAHYISSGILLTVVNIFISISAYLFLSFLMNLLTSYLIVYLDFNTVLNRTFGFLFGLIKGTLIVLALFSTVVIFRCACSKAANFKEVIRNSPADKKNIESSKLFSPICCKVFCFLENVIGKKQVDNILEKIPFFWLDL
jgi:uncharacterized membrane protein required for colicin V production